MTSGAGEMTTARVSVAMDCVAWCVVVATGCSVVAGTDCVAVSDCENGSLDPPTVYDTGIHHWFLADHVRSLTDDYLAATSLIMTDCSVDTFKRYLDTNLRMVPEKPHIIGYTAWRRVESNSLFDKAEFAGAQLVSTLEEPDLQINSRSHPQVSTSVISK